MVYLDLHSLFRPGEAEASHLLRKIVSKNILKMVDFKQMVALLDEAEVRLSSKAELAPQDILKIHRDLFNTLQDVPESAILKRAAKISTRGKNWEALPVRSQSQMILNPALIRPKSLRLCLWARREFQMSLRQQSQALLRLLT